MVQEVEHRTAGPIKLIGPVAKFSRTAAEIRLAPPVLGQDTDAILEELGHNEESIAMLRVAGVI